MENVLPLLTGFIGALIGAGASIITMYIQTNAQNKRERNKLASELAIEDFKLSLEMAKSTNKPYAILPVTCYVHYHSKLLELLDSGKLDEEGVKELTESNKTVIKAIKKANKEYDA